MYRAIILIAAAAIIFSCGGNDQCYSSFENNLQESELVIVDSIGVEMGDSSYMFGSIQNLSYAPDGSIVLLDRAFSRVMVYSPAGEFQRQIGDAGDGPGGMNIPVMMGLSENGTLLISQMDALDRFDFRSGVWIEEYPRLGGTPLPFVLQGIQDSNFVAVHMDLLEEDDRIVVEIVLGIFPPGSAEPIATLSTNSFDYDPMNAAFMFEDLLDAYSVAVSDEGTILVASNSGTDYTVTGYNADGAKISELIRDDKEPLEKSQEDIQEEREYMEARLASMDAVGLECIPDPLYPMISDIGIGPDGDLWVRRGHESLPVFDIYSDSGELSGTATLRVDPEEGRYWNVSVQPEGVLAYSGNPSEGFQKVYMIEVR